MVKFGIWSLDQYQRAGEERRYSGAHVSYALLDVGDHPSEDQIRAFEDVSFTLRTSNGTFRTTFRQRFRDVDAAALECIRELYPSGTALRVQDRAASHGLTSREWAVQLFEDYPEAEFEASDVLLYFVELSLAGGRTYIVEPGGEPIQYIRPPFVVSVHHPEPRKYPVNRFVSARARRRFERLGLPEGWTESSGGAGYGVRQISCVHPEARAFSRTNPRFQFRQRSVFEATPGACHVLRTMNIFNRDYFSEARIRSGAEAAFDSLQPGGVWIVGRTLEKEFTNHATLFRRRENGWEVLKRVGKGSDIEALALGAGCGTGGS